MKNCNDDNACNGRREFLVKATATTGGLLLSLASAGAISAQKKDDDMPQTSDEDVVVKLDANSALNKVGGSETIDTKAGKIIVVRNSDMSVSAFSAKCTHKGGPIKYDEKTGELKCPWHGSRFDVKTGAVLGGPAKSPLPAYSTENAVVVDLKPKA